WPLHRETRRIGESREWRRRVLGGRGRRGRGHRRRGLGLQRQPDTDSPAYEYYGQQGKVYLSHPSNLVSERGGAGHPRERATSKDLVDDRMGELRLGA